MENNPRARRTFNAGQVGGALVAFAPMAASAERPALLVADGWQDYCLLDAGEGMKQERWGNYTLVRPDPQIIWPRHTPGRWENWDGFYHRSEKGGG